MVKIITTECFVIILWSICNCTLTVLIHRALWRTHATVQGSHSHRLHLAKVHIVSHPLLMQSLHRLNRGRRLVIHAAGILATSNILFENAFTFIYSVFLFLHLLDNYWSIVIYSVPKAILYLMHWVHVLWIVSSPLALHCMSDTWGPWAGAHHAVYRARRGAGSRAGP